MMSLSQWLVFRMVYGSMDLPKKELYSMSGLHSEPYLTNGEKALSDAPTVRSMTLEGVLSQTRGPGVLWSQSAVTTVSRKSYHFCSSFQKKINPLLHCKLPLFPVEATSIPSEGYLYSHCKLPLFPLQATSIPTASYHYSQ